MCGRVRTRPLFGDAVKVRGEKEMKREKDYNIEFLRVLSCIFVVCIHVANVYSRSYETIGMSAYVFSVLVNTVCRISVPIFFMISGALLIEQDVNIKKNTQRVLGIIKPLIGWSLVYAVCNFFYMGKGYDLQVLFAEPVKKHLWYLYALAGLYITLPFWQKLFQGISDSMVKYFVVLWIGLLGIDYTLALLDMRIKYPIPLVGSSCYLGYFLIGYVLRHYKDRIRIPRNVCIAIAVALLAFITASTVYQSVNRGYHYEEYLEYRNVLLGIAAMCVFFAVISHKPLNFSDKTRCWLELISKHSFTIYLAHIIFLDIVRKEINIPLITSWIGIPVFAFVVFGATMLFAYVFDNAKKYVNIEALFARHRQQ